MEHPYLVALKETTKRFERLITRVRSWGIALEPDSDPTCCLYKEEDHGNRILVEMAVSSPTFPFINPFSGGGKESGLCWVRMRVEDRSGLCIGLSADIDNKGMTRYDFGFIWIDSRRRPVLEGEIALDGFSKFLRDYNVGEVGRIYTVDELAADELTCGMADLYISNRQLRAA